MSDPAAGKWENPGGRLEPGEAALEAAKREWQEETGLTLPPGAVVREWVSPDGKYVGFVYEIEDESQIDLRGDRVHVNPDDPDGDVTEALAWWAPADLRGNPAIRAELAASLDVVLQALGADDTAKAAESTAFRMFVRRVRKGDRPWRPFGFQAHPSHIGEAANSLAAEGQWAAATAVLDL